MSKGKMDFYKDETKARTERIYMEVSEQLGISYPKVVACVQDGLFRYMKEVVFLNFMNIQLRGFGTFFITKTKLNKMSDIKKERYAKLK